MSPIKKRMMKKKILDLTVRSADQLNERYVLLKLTHQEVLPTMQPGQFVEVRVDGSPTTFLRRPISICFIDKEQNELWLLVAAVGDGTRRLAELRRGDALNCVLPLGHGFSTTPPDANAAHEGERAGMLLVGGGVGVAPLLYLGAELKRQGVEPTFLLGARSRKDLLLLDEFRKYGRVFVTTEDGSEGERGFVTQHSLLGREQFGRIACCGPKPMMMAVASMAQKLETDCEVSLENMMACGLGACLCCVEKTTEGNLCVCKDGPVFNTRRLLWQTCK